MTYSNDVAVVTRRSRSTMIGVSVTAALALADKLGRPTSAAALDDARRPRCAVSELPADERQVLAQVRPRRKNARLVFIVARYFRPGRGGEHGWFDGSGGDIDVVRWWPIVGEVRA